MFIVARTPKVCKKAVHMSKFMLWLHMSLATTVHARLLQQVPPAVAGTASNANASQLSPAFTTQVYSYYKYSNNPSFTFLPGYSTHVTGQLGTLSYNIQLVNGTAAAGNSTAAAGNRTTGSANISAWHDIPLDLQTSPDGTVTINTMVEIPTGEQAKYETQTGKPGNPIQQDTKEILDAQGNVTGEVPRYYMYGPTLGNYGGLPETWSNSNKTDSMTGYPGDNDPLDVLDISSIVAPLGGVYRVKVLGALAMIDQNETDWKVMVINTQDVEAKDYKDIEDVPKERLSKILQFYANYKTAEGKPAACFWPATKGATAPVCKVPGDADPADYFHHTGHTVEIINHYQENYAWLLAGNCKSEACADLWWPGKPQKPKKKETKKEETKEDKEGEKTEEKKLPATSG